MTTEPLLVVAGEASGDLHGARLLAELVKKRPEVRPFGLGGDELAAVPGGFDAVAHASEIAVVGITEALGILPRAWQIFRRLVAETERREARCAVLIDSPDFNLRLAKRLARRGVKVLYYVSPQLWAWRKGRIRTVVRHVDRMLVVFPFETEFYRRHGVEVVHVGHPLIDEVPRLEQAWDRDPGPGSGDDCQVVALLPGSRGSEVQALLPTMLAGARRLAERRSVKVRLIQAPSVDPELVDRLVGASGLEVERVTRDRFEAIAGAHLAICASGTATLEVGLLGTPLLVVYRLTWWSHFLARLLVDLEHYSMVNLVLERGAVPELMQNDFSPENLAAEAGDLLGDPERVATMRAALAELRPRLGASGASQRAAEEVAARLDELRGGASR